MATVANIDWPNSTSDSSTTQQSQLAHYVDMMSSTHMNAVMFQARTSGDALYSSTIEPWSKYLHAHLLIGWCLLCWCSLCPAQ